MALPIDKGAFDVQAISVDLCSTDYLHTNPDSRVVHIPGNMWNAFMDRKDKSGLKDSPLYVGIRNSRKPKGKKFFFGFVVPTITSANSVDTMSLLPNWLFEYLETDPMETLVDIVYGGKPPGVTKIILKGNKSSYVSTDIRTAIENKLDLWNCINKDETFTVNDVIFTVVDIKNKEDKTIDFGSIFNMDEVKLEFNEPDDIKAAREREEARVKSEHVVQKARSYGAHVSGFASTGEVEEKIGGEKAHTYVTFQGEGLKMGGKSRILTREEKAAMLEERLKNAKQN